MKLILPIFFSFCTISSILGQSFLTQDQKTQWENFKSEYNKIYTMEEEVSRKDIFFENVHSIKQFNRERHSYKQGINQFTDMRENEIPTGFGINNFESVNSSDTFGSGWKSEDSSNGTGEILNVPEEIDWRTKNAVTPVKDQGKCGSCWAFSTVGVLEALKYRQDKKLIGISEQQLVDCDTGRNKGCQGGWMDRAFEYIKKNGGISTESCYKYTGKQGKCSYKSSCKATNVANVARIRKGDENHLKQIIGTVGPVAIAFDVSGDFSKYKSGVYNNPKCNSNKMGHAMLAVGYGRDSRQGDYWLIKNSWGARWGDKGYIKSARNKSNHCGIASGSSYAT